MWRDDSTLYLHEANDFEAVLVTSLTLQCARISPALAYSNVSADGIIQGILRSFHAAEKDKYIILCSAVISLRGSDLAFLRKNPLTCVPVFDCSSTNQWRE